MVINWPLIIILFCISAPGVLIVMPRLIYLLLPNNTEELKRRFSRFAVTQMLFLVLVMSFTGTILSFRTGLHAPWLEGVLQNGLNTFLLMLVPTILYSLLCLVVFCVLYYGVVGSILDGHSFLVMAKLRSALGVDGCVLYGGITEEVIARWGLMNLVTFFSVMIFGPPTTGIMVSSIVISGLMFAIAQIPAYLAAGCVSNRRVAYSIVLLGFWQSLVFGFLFWQYGLISAILAHIFFHLGWAQYDRVN